MKAIISTIAAIFLLALFNEGVFSGAISSQSGVMSRSSSSSGGDVRVETINGVIYCDSLKCPKNAASCQVTKRNDPNDFMKIIRHRKCIDANGKVTLEDKLTEPNPHGDRVNFNINSYASGRKLTSEEQKELDKHIKETQDMVQKDIAQINQQIRNSLRFSPGFGF